MSRKCGRKKKIDKAVDDGMQCRTEESSCTASFFAHIKLQAPCVQNNVHCIGTQVEMLIRELKKKHV